MKAAAKTETLEFKTLGEGRFALSGTLGFETAAAAMERSKELFAEYRRIEVDLAEVHSADSAGLALLVEWLNWAKHYQHELHYNNLPKQIRAIADISELEELLRTGVGSTQ